MKKLLAIILTILMIVTMIPFTPVAFAVEGDTRTIYVDWNFGWHAGNFQKMFFDSMGNELPYEFESIEDNFDLYRISVDAASYWFDFSNNGIHEGAIPEKVDYYEAATKTWCCSHNMKTSGVKNCMGQACEICGVNYGEADPDAHDWSNCDGICVNGCGAECAHADQTGSVCEICGTALHTCDFTGEWKYDSEKHWKECTCGAKEQIASHEDTLVQVDAKAPTCTEIGWDAYEYCTTCDYTTYVELPVITHTDANCDYKCDYNCGYEYETLDFSDAKVLTTVDGVLYIDGVEAETNSSKSQSRIYGGKYILEGDIETSRYIWIFGDTYLDLNGYTWNLTDKYIIVNAPLSVYDTSEAETGKITSGSSSLTISINDVAAGFNLYGGTIENTSSSGRCALDVSSADVNLYAGKIKSNSQAIRFALGREITLNIDGTVLESGDDYADVLVSLGTNDIAKGDIDVTDYKGDSLTAKVNVISTLGKITVFKGIKNTQEAEKYQIIDVVCNESFDLFWEKTEYDEATGEKSIYTANNAFTQQPSADNNLTVDFNNTAATFQWYEVEEKNLGVYTAEEFSPLFTYEFKAGDILKVSTDSEIDFVALEVGDEYLELENDSKTAMIKIDADETIEIFSTIIDSENSVDIEFSVIKETALEGETCKTLQKVECGKSYYCKATVGENVYVSDNVNILPVEHNLIQVDAQAPTCTEIGWDAYEYCTACDYTTKVEIPVDADAHDWSNKDGVCAVCGYECPHENWTDGTCDACAFECPHEDTYNNLIRPVQNADATWGKGKIVEICNICGNSSLVQEVERDHEGYKVFDETALELEAILNSGKMTDTWKNDYTNILNGLRNSAYYQVYTEIETAIPSMTESLKSIIAEIEAGIADGTMIKADFTYMTSLFDEINALIDNDPNKLIPSESGRFQGIYYGYYMSCKNNGNHSQFDYDQNMAGNNWEGQIEEILAGIKDGTALKADYTEIDEAIAKLDEKLADENLTDEAKSELEEIKAELEEMKKDPLSSKADVEELMDALDSFEEAVEDGTAVEVDGIEILLEYQDELRENLIKKYGEENYNNLMNSTTDEVKEKAIAIEEAAEALTGTVAENAEKIAEIKASFKALFDEAELCLAGTHSYTYEEISPAKCGENAIEEGTCWFCGEVLTKEVENTALTHSFTKYEETEAPKCGVEGKEVAACDNGCGATDEKEIAALTHSFSEYVYNEDATCTADGTKTAVCDNGCGETDTVTAEDTMLDHADEDGDKICDDCEADLNDTCPDCGGPVHTSELGVYICILATLIKLIVSLIETLNIL